MLYPPIEPYEIGFLKVDSTHQIYWECSGNPKGIPLLFLHGGPGSGTKPDHRRLFDPDKWKIILFDQRGCGKSTPLGSLENNNTFELVKDIEQLKKELNISSWVLYGTSWGTTLALNYAILHPKSVKALLLRAIFLADAETISWFYKEGPRHQFPKEWNAFIEPLTNQEREKPAHAYALRMRSNDLSAVKALATWELTCMKLHHNQALIEELASHSTLNSALLQTHYLLNNYFLPYDGWILKNCAILKDIPIEIIHGRYDMVCPLKNAYDLHLELPHSKLHIISDGGHSSSETTTEEALIFLQKNFLI